MTAPAVTKWTDWLKFRCTGCGNCCRETIVMLTDLDVRRIVDGTGLAPRSFVRFFGERELHMSRRHPFWIEFASRRAAMALRWGRDRCIFLDRDDRCTVYDLRPLACREHPFTIRLSERGGVTGIRLSQIVECEYELDGHLTRRQLARVSRWNESESEDYQKRVRSWNRHDPGPRTRARFMQSLGLNWESGGPVRDHSPGSSDPDPFG